MPYGDGTGPRGQGGGRGRMRGRGLGLGGYCICPKCGTRVSHQPGTPCYAMSCPKCGTKMVRE